MTTPIVGGLSLSLFVIARNFSARRGARLRPLGGFWALSRINIRECVQTPRVGGARWKAAGDTVGRRKRPGTAGEGENERKEEREGTRWEHVSHTEIVNYSFVPRWVGVIWKRDGGGPAGGAEYRGGVDGEKEDVSRGTGENDAYAHARMGERDGGDADGLRDATRARERDDAFPVSSDR